jgi:hypothetical protein
MWIYEVPPANVYHRLPSPESADERSERPVKFRCLEGPVRTVNRLTTRQKEKIRESERLSSTAASMSAELSKMRSEKLGMLEYQAKLEATMASVAEESMRLVDQGNAKILELDEMVKQKDDALTHLREECGVLNKRVEAARSEQETQLQMLEAKWDERLKTMRMEKDSELIEMEARFEAKLKQLFEVSVVNEPL